MSSEESKHTENKSLNRAGELEAILFYEVEPISVQELASIFSCGVAEIEDTLTTLDQRLQDRGVQLSRHNEMVQLVTHPHATELITQRVKKERTKELTKASLETLSIILYKNGATRADIEYIRGVNSSYILRNLLLRGLIEKKASTTDKRKNLYTPSREFLYHLGVQSPEDLPSFTDVQQKIDGALSLAEEE